MTSAATPFVRLPAFRPGPDRGHCCRSTTNARENHTDKRKTHLMSNPSAIVDGAPVATGDDASYGLKSQVLSPIEVLGQSVANIAPERSAIADELARLRAKLSGKRLFVSAGGAQGHNFLAAADLGLVAVGACSSHHDPVLDHGDASVDTLKHATAGQPEVPYGVCHKQAFQLLNQIKRVEPDVVICATPA